MRKTLILEIYLLLLSSALYSQGIDQVQKWAWGPTLGWINHLTTDSLKVYTSHLEGYAYNDNIGWIKLGSYSGGGEYTYSNLSANDYGVNNDGRGNLSGYAWSPVAGWINFAPNNPGVSIDTLSGKFSGFAYSDNLGWISFTGLAEDSSLYGVVTAYPRKEVVSSKIPLHEKMIVPEIRFIAYPIPQPVGVDYIDFYFITETSQEFFLLVYNLYGKKILQTNPEISIGKLERKVPVTRFLTSGFPAGVYLAELRTRDIDTGEIKSSVLKFIINRSN